MSDIEIVTHCWAGRLSQYATLLRLQLSSINLHPPTCAVQITVCHDPADKTTADVVRRFGPWVITMPIARLGRRAIGRNIAALETDADLVWFADCDYCFGPGCLDELLRLWREADEPALTWPTKVMIHRDHATGDRLIADAESRPFELIDVNPDDFVPKRHGYAIGGIQIAGGPYCRTHGYLADQPRWQTPVPDRIGFDDTREDMAFRKACVRRGRCVGLDVPNVFRIRHSRSGLHGHTEKVAGK